MWPPSPPRNTYAPGGGCYGSDAGGSSRAAVLDVGAAERAKASAFTWGPSPARGAVIIRWRCKRQQKDFLTGWLILTNNNNDSQMGPRCTFGSRASRDRALAIRVLKRTYTRRPWRYAF
eukprot:1374841-Pyramimonas_sp.AAC.1